LFVVFSHCAGRNRNHGKFNNEKGREPNAPWSEAPLSAFYTRHAKPRPVWARARSVRVNGLGKLAVFGPARSRSYAKLFCKKLVDRHFFFSERNEISRKVGAATMLDFFLSRWPKPDRLTETKACLAFQLYGLLAPSRSSLVCK
jgi:hypothetical protein